MALPEADTWESFSDKFLLPDVIYYGARKISLKRVWELAARRTTILDSSRAYRAVFDAYCQEAHVGTGEDGALTDYDAGWAAGMYLALVLIRVAFELPIPLPPAPPVTSTAHPGKELV